MNDNLPFGKKKDLLEPKINSKAACETVFSTTLQMDIRKGSNKRLNRKFATENMFY